MAKPLQSAAKPPIHVILGGLKDGFHSGCSIVDVSFANSFSVEVGKIHFKNYYTAWLSVKAKEKEKSGEGDGSKWKTCVPKFQMMSSAHSNQGCEDFFTISKKQMTFELNNITDLRFILRQPSPVWNEFKIEDIRIYKDAGPNLTPEVPIPRWLSSGQNSKKEIKEIKGLPPVDKLSQHLQQLWATTELATSNQTSAGLGRYDVDGSYEINLLSYT